MSAFVEPTARQALGKNSEKFDILQSHNQLPARYLQKTDKPSIYKNAEMGKASAVAAAAMARQVRRLVLPSCP
jgi:hypothetical protein